MKKNQNILKDIITEMDQKAQSSVTTFKINSKAQSALNWLLHIYNYNKTKLFDMILKNEVFINIVVQNSNKYITKVNNPITIKQRVSPKSLNTVNSLSKKHSTSRDLILTNALILLYENMSKTLNEDINLIKKLKTKLEDLNKNISSIKKVALKNNHTKKTYLKEINNLKETSSKLTKILYQDIENYNKNSQKKKRNK